jgi:hypothetical protein
MSTRGRRRAGTPTGQWEQATIRRCAGRCARTDQDSVEADECQSVCREIRADARSWLGEGAQADAWVPLVPGGRLLVASGPGDVGVSLELA